MVEKGVSSEREGDKREGWEVEETGILPVTVHNCPTRRNSFSCLEMLFCGRALAQCMQGPKFSPQHGRQKKRKRSSQHIVYVESSFSEVEQIRE